MTQIRKSASNPLGLARTEEIYSYEGGGCGGSGGGSLALLTAPPPTALPVVLQEGEEEGEGEEVTLSCTHRNTLRNSYFAPFRPTFLRRGHG